LLNHVVIVIYVSFEVCYYCKFWTK